MGDLKAGDLKVTDDEVIRKIIGMMRVIGDAQIPYIKFAFEDDKHILIQDFSRVIVRSHKLTWDAFVTMDGKLILEIVRGLQNDK
tara:strand:+ start:32 stop:286 length:255 start_codon:yes stop_codon:yes gene_type:complete